jgi:hypothetical protein
MAQPDEAINILVMASFYAKIYYRKRKTGG